MANVYFPMDRMEESNLTEHRKSPVLGEISERIFTCCACATISNRFKGQGCWKLTNEIQGNGDEIRMKKDEIPCL